MMLPVAAANLRNNQKGEGTEFVHNNLLTKAGYNTRTTENTLFHLTTPAGQRNKPPKIKRYQDG
jgi:hypothetical protein